MGLRTFLGVAERRSTRITAGRRPILRSLLESLSADPVADRTWPRTRSM